MHDPDSPDPGTVDTCQTVKAGCGIRYDPDQLGEDSGFDFSDAARLMASQNPDSIEPSEN